MIKNLAKTNSIVSIERAKRNWIFIYFQRCWKWGREDFIS